MTGATRYSILLLGWLLLWWLPVMAGNWYDDHYHVYQALTSLGVIAMARKLYPGVWWADDLAVVAMLQIVHAISDAFADAFWPATDNYNTIQAGLNALEALFLSLGGMMELIHGHRGTAGDRNTGSNSADRAERRGHA